MDDDQSLERSDRLTELEAVIDAEADTLKRSARAVADALAEIKRDQWYRLRGLSTWDDYTRARWNMTPQHANRIIRFGETFAAIAGTEPMGSLPRPTSERQVRPLTQLPTPDDKRAAWAEAVERADGEQPTARQVEAVVRERQHEPGQRPTGPRGWHHGKRHLVPSRIVTESVAALQGIAMGLALIKPEDVTDAALGEWVRDMRAALVPIEAFRKGLERQLRQQKPPDGP